MEHNNEHIRPKKTSDAKAYIREWKRKDYAENGDKIKSKNKAYYYKYKCGLSNEDMDKYDTLLPYVAKIKMAVDEFKEADIALCMGYLTGLLDNIKEKQGQPIC